MTKKKFGYPKYLGERIRSARINLGLSQEKLADSVELPRPAISQIEGGKRAIDSVELVALSRVLQKPVSFFVEEDISDASQEDPIRVLYRADEISEQDRALVDDFKTLCKDYSTLESLLELEARVTLPKWTADVNTKWQAIRMGEEAAFRLRGDLSLGFGPIGNLPATLETHGVKVIHRQMKDSKAWGFSITSRTLGNCIFVNSSCVRQRQFFTLAHELGHLLLDHNHSATIYSDAQSPERTLDDGKTVLIETRANAFAAAFLVPELGLKELLSKFGIFEGSNETLTPPVVGYMAHHFGVSYDSMLWRLVNVKIITKADRDEFVMYQPPVEKAPEEPNPTPLPERYRTLAIEAYRRMKISIGKLADFLRTDIYEARKLMQQFGIQQSPA